VGRVQEKTQSKISEPKTKYYISLNTKKEYEKYLYSLLG